MNQSIKKKWVKALLSGKYEQLTDGFLKTGNRYCCLGVLREITGGNANIGSLLSLEELSYFKLAHKEQVALAKTNDKGVPFEMIAGLIDEAL